MALNNLFNGVYAGKRVLVTGHTGFKGSWLSLWLRSMGAQVAGLSLDPDTEPSHWNLLALDDIADYRVDIRNASAVKEVFDLQKPEIVFHLAAQPLVRRSYQEPVNTFDVNVMGLINILEASRHCSSVRAIVNATTDKVYEDHITVDGYRETDALGGHDPYSSSKACAEIVSSCYRKSFFNAGCRLATARAGNVIGGGDWAEDRLVPDLVRAAVTGHALKIRNPAATRPWQHALEPLSGYLNLGQKLLEDDQFADAWNFGPESEGERSVREIAGILCKSWPNLGIEIDDGNHPHEAFALHLNCEKAKQKLAWRPVWNLESALKRTADWYRDYYQNNRVGSVDDLAAYTNDAHQLGLGWAT
ncbi:MAG: CDP-glucose 4,6-dehydratase [Arenimonas sp.]